MVQLKVLLDTRRSKSDGTFPIMFRITNRKQVNYISFGHSIDVHIWDENDRCINSLHPNSKFLNVSLSKKFYEIQKAMLLLEESGHFTFQGLKDILKTKSTGFVPLKKITVKVFALKLITQMLEVKKTGNAMVYQTAINRFLNFCNNEKIEFKDIDYELLENFRNKLTNDGVKINTISNYFRTLRAIYNKAIKAKVVEKVLYPFTEIKIKHEKTAKRSILVKDLKALNDLDLKAYSKCWHARNYFFLSFYMIGMSFTDLAYIQNSNVVDGRLNYKRRKTHKTYSIKIIPKVEILLKHYSNSWSDYLLPIIPSSIEENTTSAKRVIRQWIKTTNKYLNRIGKEIGLNTPLTTYVTRHTWATTAKRLGYSIELIADALGHEQGNSITNIYLDKYETEIVDAVNWTISESVTQS